MWGTVGGSHKKPLIVNCTIYMIWTWLTTVYFNENWTSLQFANKLTLCINRIIELAVNYFKIIYYGEVNVVLAEAKCVWRVRNGSRIRTPGLYHRTWQLVTPPKVFPYFIHWCLRTLVFIICWYFYLNKICKVLIMLLNILYKLSLVFFYYFCIHCNTYILSLVEYQSS